MKKNILKSAVCVITAMIFAVLVMAFSQSEAFAGEWYFDDAHGNRIEENALTDALWGSEYEYDNVTYFELKPSKTGFITFTAWYSGYTALCDSNKKVVSIGSYSGGDYLSGLSTFPYQRTISYGVKAGKTYYLMMTGMPNEKNEDGIYTATVKWTNTKVKSSKYGAKKSKSVAIKRGKTVKGLFVAGNKKGQWFKITNKQKKTKITFTSKNNNDKLKVLVYYKSFNKWYKSTHYVYRSDSGYKNVLTGTVSRKIKHTYYLKVYPDGKSSGMYTLKWK